MTGQKQRLLFLVLISLSFVHCTKSKNSESSNTETKAPDTTVAQITIPPTPEVGPPAEQTTVGADTSNAAPIPSPLPKTELAVLKEFLPRVTFRRQSEVAWEEAAEKLPLFRFDAVRTHQKAQAKISFLNGSVVDLGADSLLIINSSEPMTASASIDKVLVRKGKLKAQTQKDLWILTSAALYRIWPDKKKAVASGVMTLNEGKKVTFELKQGEGMLLPLSKTKSLEATQPVKLLTNKPIVLAAPIAAPDFGEAPQSFQWPEVAVMDKKRRDIASVSSLETKPTPISPDFVIQYPLDYAEVSESNTELRGIVRGGEGTLQVNGKTVSINKKGEFRTQVKLNVGANAILIQWNVSQQTPVFRRWTIIRR